MMRSPYWTPDKKAFRAISETAGLLSWICESDGFCVYLSPAWYAATGTDDGLGMHWLNAIHPDDRTMTSRAFFDAIERQGRYTAEYRLIRPDGSYVLAVAQGGAHLVEGAYQGMFGFTTMLDKMTALSPAPAEPDCASHSRRLSDREREVFALLAEGVASDKIADQLEITPSTVAAHISHAVAKLGASNRTHAVVLAMRLNEL
jgi:PAS domain S-box-containing protein